MMHHSAPVSQMVLPFCVPSSPLEFDLGPQLMPPNPHRSDFSASWEMRCLRKKRRRGDDNVCSAKRRRLMRPQGAQWDSCAPHPSVDELGADSCSSVCPPPALSPALTHTHTPPADTSTNRPAVCMEMEAAQQRLREIEDRITLEDDSDSDLDLDVEVCPRRPVLVLSDSLKEGLQRGISDILPHTVAQSVSHSCMELVLWRPPDDPFSHCVKDSAHKASKHEPPTLCPSPSPRSDLLSSNRTPGSGDEEDMEI